MGELLYHVGADGKQRLCIPNALENEIFRLAHDDRNHPGYHRTYEHIAEALYIRKLSRRLRKYVELCPVCLLAQTKRHKPYGSLEPIVTPPIVGHTITIDFIMALPMTKSNYNCALTVTCKFSKRVTILPGKDTYTAEEWAKILLDGLADWGVPKAIISDRDPKFLSDLWLAIFRSLGVKILATTAYHPQSDGQSERTNQTVEVALRFYLMCYPEGEWDKFLPMLRARLNNSSNASTGRSPNEIIYGTKTNEPLSLIGATYATDVEQNRTLHQREAEDAIAFANVNMKMRYDSKHQRLVLKEGDSVYLKLHKGYSVSGIHHKLGQQRVGPLKVLKKIGNLAYKLEIPPTWRIHDVVSVAMLEPAPSQADPYDRPHEDHPGAIEDENNNEEAPTYEVEKIVDGRKRRYGRSQPRQEYLVKWKGWGPEWNQWMPLSELESATEVVQDYERRF